MSTLTLVSHPLCPYVQRAAIVLREKGIPFERIDIDLAHKPEWFLRLSPLGKTPLLVADGTPLFESAVICEYLDDTTAPRLHPAPPLERARHRAWIEFASATLNEVAALYNAPDAATLQVRAAALQNRWRQLEAELAAGPFFAGRLFSMVDAAFAPLFRYFDVLETHAGLHLFEGVPRVAAWRAALRQRPSVRDAVRADYAQLLRDFLAARGSALSQRMETVLAQAR